MPKRRRPKEEFIDDLRPLKKRLTWKEAIGRIFQEYEEGSEMEAPELVSELKSIRTEGKLEPSLPLETFDEISSKCITELYNSYDLHKTPSNKYTFKSTSMKTGTSSSVVIKSQTLGDAIFKVLVESNRFMTPNEVANNLLEKIGKGEIVLRRSSDNSSLKKGMIESHLHCMYNNGWICECLGHQKVEKRLYIIERKRISDSLRMKRNDHRMYLYFTKQFKGTPIDLIRIQECRRGNTELTSLSMKVQEPPPLVLPPRCPLAANIQNSKDGSTLEEKNTTRETSKSLLLKESQNVHLLKTLRLEHKYTVFEDGRGNEDFFRKDFSSRTVLGIIPSLSIKDRFSSKIEVVEYRDSETNKYVVKYLNTIETKSKQLFFKFFPHMRLLKRINLDWMVKVEEIMYDEVSPEVFHCFVVLEPFGTCGLELVNNIKKFKKSYLMNITRNISNGIFHLIKSGIRFYIDMESIFFDRDSGKVKFLCWGNFEFCNIPLTKKNRPKVSFINHLRKFFSFLFHRFFGKNDTFGDKSKKFNTLEEFIENVLARLNDE